MTLLFAHLKSEAAIHESISADRLPFLRNSFILVAYFKGERALLFFGSELSRIGWIIGQECDGNEGKRLWAAVVRSSVMNSK